jgi:hypothetical protein
MIEKKSEKKKTEKKDKKFIGVVVLSLILTILQD